jgi:hypothetical protein
LDIILLGSFSSGIYSFGSSLNLKLPSTPKLLKFDQTVDPLEDAAFL